MRALQKKMQQLENDLDQAQEQLLAANSKLEEKEKALQNVSHISSSSSSSYYFDWFEGNDWTAASFEPPHGFPPLFQ